MENTDKVFLNPGNQGLKYIFIQRERERDMGGGAGDDGRSVLLVAVYEDIWKGGVGEGEERGIPQEIWSILSK